MILTALLFAMQAAQPAPQPEMDSSVPAPWPDSERELRTAGAFGTPADLEARLHLERYAACIVRKNPALVATTLTMDFTSEPYRKAMRSLSEQDKECMGSRREMRSSGLLYAGELAEALLESETAPLVSRLAKASAAPATPSFSFTDKVAICVVRSVPNDVAALFATARGSAEETASINALALPMGMCARAAAARKPISVSPAGLRAMLATASYRSLASLKDT